MNKEMLKNIMSNMDIAKDLDEYGKNKTRNRRMAKKKIRSNLSNSI
jgi:hypothetical protein